MESHRKLGPDTICLIQPLSQQLTAWLLLFLHPLPDQPSAILQHAPHCIFIVNVSEMSVPTPMPFLSLPFYSAQLTDPQPGLKATSKLCTNAHSPCAPLQIQPPSKMKHCSSFGFLLEWTTDTSDLPFSLPQLWLLSLLLVEINALFLSMLCTWMLNTLQVHCMHTVHAVCACRLERYREKCIASDQESITQQGYSTSTHL